MATKIPPHNLTEIKDAAITLVYNLAAKLHEILIFFFQAEDGIRDLYVTGAQTCALPISARAWRTARGGPAGRRVRRRAPARRDQPPRPAARRDQRRSARPPPTGGRVLLGVLPRSLAEQTLDS